MAPEADKPFDNELKSKELRLSFFSPFLVAAAKVAVLERASFKLAFALEGGMTYSLTARLIMQKRYGVRIGAFSYGGCFNRGALPPGVVVGRYVSIGSSLKVFRRDRFLDWLSLHPFFYNPMFGFARTDPIFSPPFVIEHDAWIGERVLITPGCARVGIGSVIGAGSVVTKDVPDFALVAGNPARLIRYRFSESVRNKIRDSLWWQLPLPKLLKHFPDMTKPIGEAEWLTALARLSNSHHN